MRTIRVAVAGLGFVGREAVRLLRANAVGFSERLGARVELCAVADRDASAEARRLGLPASVRRVKDPLQLLQEPVDIVVELLGGLEAPKRLALATLGEGKHLVTANKRLLAFAWKELHERAAARGGRLYFEGSVAGGIPLLQALDQSFSANRIEGLYGILNGTTNYILTRAEEGLSMEEALREAQRLGLAEKDPTLDLSGGDSAQKVAVLGSLLTGGWVRPGAVATEGITRITREDVEFCRKSLGGAVRLLGRLALSPGRPFTVEAEVSPTLVPLSHPLAAVRREYNAVFVKTSSAEDLMFYGKGAGPGPTASAVVGDVFMLSRDLLGGMPAARRPVARAVVADPDASVSGFYLRLMARDKPGVLARVTAALGRRGISIATIHQSEPGRGPVPIMITTHPTSRGSLRRALREILAGPSVARAHAVMRLLA